jgi:nicotinamidase-related amidase
MEKNNNLKLLLPEECLLLIVDLQDKFLPVLKHSGRVLQSTKLLIAVATELRIPIVVTEHNPQRIGPTVQELAVKLKNVPVFAKDIFSCFGDAAIKKAIGAHENLKNILLVGCETHICIMQTTIDALTLGSQWCKFKKRNRLAGRTGQNCQVRRGCGHVGNDSL